MVSRVARSREKVVAIASSKIIHGGGFNAAVYKLRVLGFNIRTLFEIPHGDRARILWLWASGI
jgi:hypothetical protein